MRIASIRDSGVEKACFNIDGELYDINEIVKILGLNIDKNGKNINEYICNGNIFKFNKLKNHLDKSFEFINFKIESKKIDELQNILIKKNEIKYRPPVFNCPNMFGIVQNSPQFWRKKNECIKKFVAGYIRAPGSMVGHEEIVEIPPYCGSFRAAAELGVVIGNTASKVSESSAMEYVFGYTCVNDMISNYWKEFTIRNNPKNEPRFFEYLVTSYYGRGTKTFGPVGPFIVSKDEIDDPYNLLLFTKFNGEIMDRAYNNSMINGIEKVISDLSSFMTLNPGTIIHMGTMGIDGITFDADKPLNDKDYVEIEIENIGILRNYFNDKRFRGK